MAPTRFPFPTVLLALLALGGLTSPARAAADEAPEAGSSGFSPEHMDRGVDPRQDFYRFAAGGWLVRTEIPADKARWGAFDELAQRTLGQVRALLEQAAAERGAPGSPRQLAGDFYTSALNRDAIEALGTAPIEPWLQRIATVGNGADALRVAAELRPYEIHAFLNFWVFGDSRNSSVNTIYFSQGGLGLQNRDYYDAERFEAIRTAYREHIARQFVLLGDTAEAAAVAAAHVYTIESALAAVSRRPVDLRDPVANYTAAATATLDAEYGLGLTAYLDTVGVRRLEQVVVRQPEFVRGLARVLDERSPAELQAYLRWVVIRSTARFLPQRFVDESFAFFGKTLSGSQQLEPEWMRAIRRANEFLGDAVSQLYVERHFPESARERADSMVAHIKATFRSRLERLTWMTEETRARALAKFDAFGLKIGHPETWRDYAGLEIRPDTFFANVMAAAAWEFRREMAKAGGPVDRTEWGLAASEVNAYYSPLHNEIVFPAAILQPPFFDPQADDAVNFGGIGAVIAHEITHGFDDSGRNYDGTGNLADWWTPEDEARFAERTGLLVTQYAGYEVAPGLNINGELSLGENIADLGGVTVALEALQRSLEAGARPGLIDGFTPEQRFFLAWAQIWRTLYRPAALERQITVGPHPPGSVRAFAPLRNLAAFHEAFGVRAGDALWLPPEQRALIW